MLGGLSAAILYEFNHVLIALKIALESPSHTGILPFRIKHTKLIIM